MLNRSSTAIGARAGLAVAACLALAACAEGTPEDATDNTPREQPAHTRPIISDPRGQICGADVCAFPSSIEATPDAFVAWYVAEFLTDDRHRLELERELGGFIPGSVVRRYVHLYEGVRVDEDGLRLVVRDGLVTAAVGKLTTRIEASVTPSVSEQAAIVAGQSAAGRGARFAPQGHSCALSLRPGSDAAPRPSLRYLCHLAGDQLGIGYAATVDAMTGEVHGVYANAMFDADWDVVPATAQTGWHGPQQVHVSRHISTNTYYLDGPTVSVRNGLLNTVPVPFMPDPPLTLEYLSTTGIFGLDQKEGGAAYWGAERTLDYLASEWGMVPSTPLRIVSNVSGWDNAMYELATGRFWFGETLGPVLSRTALDTVAHEIGHKLALDSGLLETCPGNGHPTICVPYKWFYRAVHESFADIVGELTEQHVFGATDWIHGSDYYPHGTQRNLRDPWASNPTQPDVLFGYNYSDSSDAYHDAASIPSLFFTRLAGVAPGTGTTSNLNLSASPPIPPFSFEVEPIGQKSAFLIFVRMLELMSTHGDEYNAYNVSTTAAKEACGLASQEAISVHNAWYSVFGPPFTPITTTPYAKPASGDTNVHPWPARLHWQAQIASWAEADWDVQVSPDPTFPPESTHTSTTAATDFDNGHVVGWAEFLLDSNTTYYWRVRISDGDPSFDCWRPLSSFTTGNAAPTPFYPIGSNIHPWSIPFAYSHQEGATFYEIEVSASGNQIAAPGDPENDGRFANPVFPPQLIPAQPSPDQITDITVPKNKKLMWHVRGIYKKDGQPTQYSGWSTTTPFQTNEPTVTLFAPANNSPSVYPWPIIRIWNPLPGAEFTLVTQHLLWDGTPGTPTPMLIGEQISFTGYHRATGYLSSDPHRKVTWWVTAEGPPLGSKLTPEPPNTREAAKPSTPWSFIINADDTVVSGINGPSSCQEWGSSHTLSWPSVQGATHYMFLRDGKAGWESTDVVGTNTTVVLNHVNAGTAAFLVRAMHEAIWGAGQAKLEVPVRPTTPSITAIYPDSSDPSFIDFDFTTQYAYANKFDLRVYEGSGCSGALVHANTLPLAPKSDGISYGGTLEGFKDGSYSMKIRSVQNPTCNLHSSWSPCANFSHINPKPFEIVSFTDPLHLTFNGSPQPTFIAYQGYPAPQYPLKVVAEPAGPWPVEWDLQGGSTTIWSPQDPVVAWGYCGGYGVLWQGGESDWVSFLWNIYLEDANGMKTQVIHHTHKCWKPGLGPG